MSLTVSNSTIKQRSSESFATFRDRQRRIDTAHVADVETAAELHEWTSPFESTRNTVRDLSWQYTSHLVTRLLTNFHADPPADLLEDAVLLENFIDSFDRSTHRRIERIVESFSETLNSNEISELMVGALERAFYPGEMIVSDTERFHDTLSALEDLAALHSAIGIDPRVLKSFIQNADHLHTQESFRIALNLASKPEEARGYLRYTHAREEFRALADDYINQPASYKLNYATRREVVKFLEEREDAGNLSEAIYFIKALTRLRQHVNSDGSKIRGMDRPLRNIQKLLKDELQINGAYLEVAVVESLIESGFDITEVSMKKLTIMEREENFMQLTSLEK